MVDVAAARAECKEATRAKIVVVWAEADDAVARAQAEVEKAVEDEFGVGFF